MFKTILTGAAGSVLGAVVVALLGIMFSVTTAADLQIVYNWVDVPNPTQLQLNTSTAALDAFKKAPLVSAEDFYNKIRFRPTLRIIQITIRNSGRARSGNIDINTPEVVQWHYDVGDKAAYESGSKLTLLPLDPGITAKIFAVSTAPYGDQQVNVLDDGKLTNAHSVHSDLFGPGAAVAWLYLVAPEPIVVLAGVGILLLLLLIFAAGLSAYTKSSLERRVRFTSKDEIREMRDLLGYIEKNHPDKLE